MNPSTGNYFFFPHDMEPNFHKIYLEKCVFLESECFFPNYVRRIISSWI